MEKTKINLGCGKMYLDGWWNIDNQSMYVGETKVDEQADCINYELPNDSVDYLLVSHFIQYIKPEEMSGQLKKWYGWLSLNGAIDIEATHFDYILDKAKENKDWARVHLFGDKQTCPCRWSWNESEIVELMKQVGFNNIETLAGHYHNKPDRDFLIRATK